MSPVEIRRIASALSVFFGEHANFEAIADQNVDLVACHCTKPRGYWTGIPLILQRNQEPVRLNELLIINFADKVYIRHGKCPDCRTIYFKVEAKGVKSKEASHAHGVGGATSSVLQKSS